MFHDAMLARFVAGEGRGGGTMATLEEALAVQEAVEAILVGETKR